jgi:DNA-binding CsgD family transcriptional regulator
MFVGRERERARIDRLLGDARAGRSGALLMHGEAGIGKTALMRWAIGQASGMRVLRARGIETESDIPFAGLAELLTPLLDRLDDVPEVQARALRGALALGPATPHDRFTVPAGLLSLLAVAAEEQPVLVAIDDAQWLDDASLEAFLFAGRRIEAEGIAMLGSLRDGTGVAGMDVPWLERMAVSPLADDEARELLGSAQPERLAPSVADRLVSTAAGNPLALLEIPRQLSDGQRAGREPLEEPLRPGTGVERAFRRALDALDDGARSALLVAATAHTGRIDVIEPALIGSGLALDDLRAAEEARLLSTAEGEIDFRHPLLRSTAYHAASAPERRAAHRALAAAAPGGSPERAWHLAACAVAPDEEVAAALEAAALDARGRGAHATAARDFGRAAQLTPEDEPRARRLLEAATDATRSGEADRAFALLGDAARLTLDPLLAADVQRMTGHVEMRRGSPLVAYELLVAEAERVRSRDPRRAAGMFLEASVSHMITGDMHALVATAERARALATSADPAVELLATAVIGEAYLALGDVEQGDALLSACEPYLLEGDPLAIVEVVGMAAHSSIWIEKFDRAERIFDRLIAAARDASAVSALIYPLAARSHLDFRLGRWAAARAGAAESVELAHDTGQLPILAHSLSALAHVEAALGQEEECRGHVSEGLALVARFQGDATGAYLTAALGLLELGLGRIPEAIAVLEDTQRTADRLGMQPSLVMSTPDLIEAYARASRRDEAQELLEGFEARGRRTGARWAEAAVARLRGLLAPDAAMRAQFDAALALHDGLPMPFEHARTLLCLGERMRRARQRADAREPLKEALETFERLGARGWAERTRTELRATGEQQSRRTETAAEQLTPHELQIAVLVAQGMTNREAAAALFLSPKTIEYHLGQIYRKLDVRGRAQLARLMAMELPEGERDPSVLAEAMS